MANLNKDNRDQVKTIRNRITSLTNTIKDYINTGRTKKVTDIEELIKLCKLLETEYNKLAKYGLKSDITRTKLNYRYWESKLNNTKSNIGINTLKKSKKSKKSTGSTTHNDLYYIMLCWTVKQGFFICDNIVNTINKYFEKLKLEFIDTQSDNFPDRTEFVNTYKIKTTPEVYKTIMDSVEFIIDTNTASIHEKCNVGVFGKKIE